MPRARRRRWRLEGQLGTLALDLQGELARRGEHESRRAGGRAARAQPPLCRPRQPEAAAPLRPTLCVAPRLRASPSLASLRLQRERCLDERLLRRTHPS